MSSSEERGSHPTRSGRPTTVTRPELLDEDGDDRRFRRFIYDFFTVSTWMYARREYFASRIGVTGPQFSVLMAIANLSMEGDVTVGRTAELMQVSGPFVTVETGKLVKRGLVEKRTNPRDRRSVLLTLTDRGRGLVDSIAIEMRRLNDAYYEKLDATQFRMLSDALRQMAESSAQIIEMLDLGPSAKRSRLSRWRVAAKRRARSRR